MFHKNSVIPTAVEGFRCDNFKLTFTRSLDFARDDLQFLRDLLEHVALDDVAHLIFAKVSQLNSAFEPGAHFFHVVLEPAQSREPAIVNRLAAP